MHMHFSEKEQTADFYKSTLYHRSVLNKNQTKIFLPTGVGEHFLMDGEMVKNNRSWLPPPML